MALTQSTQAFVNLVRLRLRWQREYYVATAAAAAAVDRDADNGTVVVGWQRSPLHFLPSSSLHNDTVSY